MKLATTIIASWFVTTNNTKAKLIEMNYTKADVKLGKHIFPSIDFIWLMQYRKNQNAKNGTLQHLSEIKKTSWITLSDIRNKHNKIPWIWK